MSLKQMHTFSYATLSLEEVWSMLQTSREGLKESDVLERRRIFGYNEREALKPSLLVFFLSRYVGPMPLMLEIALILSFLLGRNVEGVIIFGILTINACMGFCHERNAQKAVELLEKKLAFKARVVRDGRWMLIEAKELTRCANFR
jgi:H+-transporting ATPase